MDSSADREVHVRARMFRQRALEQHRGHDVAVEAMPLPVSLWQLVTGWIWLALLLASIVLLCRQPISLSVNSIAYIASLRALPGSGRPGPAILIYMAAQDRWRLHPGQQILFLPVDSKQTEAAWMVMKVLPGNRRGPAVSVGRFLSPRTWVAVVGTPARGTTLQSQKLQLGRMYRVQIVMSRGRLVSLL